MQTATPPTASDAQMSITDHKRVEVERANKTGLQPVVFVHGLWLLPSSWDRWAKVFEEADSSRARRLAGRPKRSPKQTRIRR